MSAVDKARDTFANNVESVQQLVDFDRTVLEAAIQNISRLQKELDERNPAVADRVGNTLAMLTNIRNNDTMRQHYVTIYNQCIVLLVSHFGSALHEMFVSAAPTRLGVTSDQDSSKDELKFSIAELRELEFDLKGTIGALLVAKRDIKFQDMQSTVRAFKNYLGVDIARDADMDNVILAQSARHVIVHSGGLVTATFMRRIASARSRKVKTTVVERQYLAFSPDEVDVVATSMQTFVDHVATALAASA
jgi:hypothetical protein